MSQNSNEIQALFLKKKPSKILIDIKRNNENGEKGYALKLARNADTTYSHTVRVLQRMEEKGVVGFERDGRKKLVHLTDLGDELAEDLISFWRKCGDY